MKRAKKSMQPEHDDTQISPLGDTDFQVAMMAMLAHHRPSRMSFFKRIASAPLSVASDPLLLGKIHLNYQAAMHATRAGVYYLPHMDSPALRQRKLRIFIDDDGLPEGDTHHYQLTRAFRTIGANCLLDDEAFGEPAELSRHLEAETARFVTLAPKLYARSLGPWCAIEALSVDWMRALAEALSVHFPEFSRQAYFAECFKNQIEERHSAEALEVTQTILCAHPEFIQPTFRDAKTIARALDGVWVHLDRIVCDALNASSQSVKSVRILGQQNALRKPIDPL